MNNIHFGLLQYQTIGEWFPKWGAGLWRGTEYYLIFFFICDTVGNYTDLICVCVYVHIYTYIYSMSLFLKTKISAYVCK